MGSKRRYHHGDNQTNEQTNKKTESDSRASQLIGTWTADFRNTNRQEIQTQPVRCSASLSAYPPSACAPSEFPASSSGGSPNYDDDDIGEESAK